MKAHRLLLVAIMLSTAAPASAAPPSFCAAAAADEEPEEEPRRPLIVDPNEERRLAGWTLVSGGVLFLLASVASTFRINKLNGQIDDLAGTPEANTARIQELIDEQDTFEGLQLVGLLGGAARGLGGVTLLIVDARQSPTRSHISLSPWLAPDAAGVGIGGDF